MRPCVFTSQLLYLAAVIVWARKLSRIESYNTEKLAGLIRETSTNFKTNKTEKSNWACRALTTKNARTLHHIKTVYIFLLFRMNGWKVHCNKRIKEYQYQNGCSSLETMNVTTDKSLTRKKERNTLVKTVSLM